MQTDEYHGDEPELDQERERLKNVYEDFKADNCGEEEEEE